MRAVIWFKHIDPILIECREEDWKVNPDDPNNLTNHLHLVFMWDIAMSDFEVREFIRYFYTERKKFEPSKKGTSH